MNLFAIAMISAAAAVGINLGNVLEAPVEGAWAPVAQEYYFDDYVAAGFTVQTLKGVSRTSLNPQFAQFVRVPVRWDNHSDTTPPYTIDPTFLARVHEVTGWGLARNLTVIVNSHHDDWLDDATAFAAMLPRFTAIWTQVAASFASAPPTLFFEVFNEPHVMTLAQLNAMNAAVVPIMRAQNPTRPIYLGGLSWMSAYWLTQNPDAMVFPPLASGARDPNLRVEVHSYDPYEFCLQDPPTSSSWGSAADVAAVQDMYLNVSTWSAAHGTSVLMGEAGCQVAAPSRPDRLQWYATVATSAQLSIGGHLCIWDDDGDYKVYDRTGRSWDEGVLQALGLK